MCWPLSSMLEHYSLREAGSHWKCLIYTLKWPRQPGWPPLHFLLVSCCSFLTSVCQKWTYSANKCHVLPLNLSLKCPKARTWCIITSLHILVLIGALVCGWVVAGALFHPYSVCVCRGESGWKCLPAAECHAGHHPGQRRTAAHHVHPVQGAWALTPASHLQSSWFIFPGCVTSNLFFDQFLLLPKSMEFEIPYL